jgi:TonB-linked SusC/RagA family outer membrane protein
MTRGLLLVFTLALLAVSAQDAAAQARRVTGRVTNAETAAPMSGVQVLVKGTSVMSITDANGNYVIDVPAAGSVLVFGSLGFRAVEMPIRSEVVNAALASDVIALDALVVTAMGITQRERAIGTSVQTVRSEQLVQAREANLVSALAGRAAGVDVRSTGTQGGSARVVIRGASSIQGNNQPLFVVDGVPIDNSMCQGARCITGGAGAGGNQGSVDYGNAAQDINPNDIESITILKGPNAAALYGSRAANGAIVITTRSGRGAMRPGGEITFSQNVSFETPLRLPSYQNVFGQGSRGEFSYVDGKGGGLHDGTDESWGPPLDGRSICQFNSPGAGSSACQGMPWIARPNNIRDFFNTGRTLTTHGAFAAANEAANIRISVTNVDQDGMYPEMKINRLTTALNAGAQLATRVRADGSVQYIRSEGNNRPGVGYLGTNPMQQFIWFGRQVDMSALRSYRNEDGTLFNWNHQYFGNPFFMAKENRNEDQRDRIIGNVGVAYQFTPWLSARVSTGTDWYEDYRKRTYAHGNIGLAFAQRGGLYEQQIYRQETGHNLLVSANRTLAPDLTLSVNAGAARGISDARFHNVGTNQLVVPGVYNFANAVATPPPVHELRKKRINSLYGQAQFGYRNLLFVDVTGRNDWSSTLPEDHNSYFYPSISTSVVVSDLVPSLQNTPLAFAKLRGSWARVGNDADPYQTGLVYSSATAWGGSPNFTVPNALPNTGLKPEETTSIEFGTDLRFFRDRLGLDITYYSAETTNQILPVQVSATSGYTSRVINAGTMTNRGIELLATVTPVRTSGGFQWDVTANYARNRNEVKELYDGLETLVLGSYWSLNVEARQGQPYGVLWGRKYVRDPQGRIVVGANGLPINLNTNPNGILGNYNPDWSGSLSNSFRYRNLDVSFMLDTQQGGHVFSVTQYFGTYAGVLPETLEGRCGGPNLPACATHGFMVPNSVQRQIAGNDTTYIANSTRVSAEEYWHNFFGLQEPFVLDASFVKLREVRIGYAVPARIADRLRLSSMSVSLVGRNLWLNTPMPHIDPEVAFDASNVQGLEFGSLPSARSFGIFVAVTPRS